MSMWAEQRNNSTGFCKQMKHESQKVSQVCNETDAQLIISKYKKNTIKRKRRALYRDEKIKCFNLKVLVSN